MSAISGRAATRQQRSGHYLPSLNGYRYLFALCAGAAVLAATCAALMSAKHVQPARARPDVAPPAAEPHTGE